MIYEVHDPHTGEICGEWVYHPIHRVICCSHCSELARENPVGWRRYDYHCQNCGKRMINPRFSWNTLMQELRYRKLMHSKQS